MTKLCDQLFFKDRESEVCYALGSIHADMIADGIDQTHVYKAVRNTGEGYFWCKVQGECGESGQGGCGRECSEYKPRNGKNGRCLHSGFCYEHGQAFILHKDGKLVKA